MSIIHTEVIDLEASPERVREFIMTPDRILDYYPNPIDGDVLEARKAIWCRGEMGVSLLERIEEQCSDDLVVLRVATAIGLQPPYTRERIDAATTFTMIEDWALVASGSGTRLTKTWRDAEARGQAPFPIEEAVRQSAMHETRALVEGWNEANRTVGS